MKVTRFIALTLAVAVIFALSASALAAKSPYKGSTVRFLAARNIHQTALGDKMAEIAKKWGVDFEARYVTTDQLKKKVVLDYVGGAETWDLVYTGGIQRMYELYDRGIIDDMTPLIDSIGDKNVLQWDEFTGGAKNAAMFGDKVLGLAVATSDQTLAYRADLVNNPDEKVAFKAKYGYELQVPENYKQFYDVAQFFTRKKGDKLAGKVLDHDFYGTSFSNKKGTYVWHDYQNQILAFGVQIYNPETGKAEFDSPQSIEAAQYYQSLVPFLPPNHINQSSGESTAVFAAGDVAMIIEYFDRVVSKVGNEDAAVYGKVEYALPPSKVGNPLNRKHSFRSGPATVAIYSRSRSKEAAYKLLEAAITSDNQYDMAKTHPGYMPTKTPALKRLIADKPYVEYLVKAGSDDVDSLTDAAIMPYPSILKSSDIGDIISDAMSEILIGASVEKELADAQMRLEETIADLNK